MSELRVDTLANAAGTGPADMTGQWAARAYWVIEIIGPESITDSGNVSAVSDSGVGLYDVTFTNNFAASDRATTLGTEGVGTGAGNEVFQFLTENTATTSLSEMYCINIAEAGVDSAAASGMCMGALA